MERVDIKALQGPITVDLSRFNRLREDKGGVKKMKEMMSWRRTWVPMGLFGAAEEETRGRRGGKREKKTEREKMLLSRSNK